MADMLNRFTFDGAPVRGALVTLDSTWSRMLRGHDYPEPVARLLGELVSATALLASTIRNDGTLTLQLRGNGPVSVAMAECRNGEGYRGIARVRDDQPVAGELDFGALLGNGDLAITLQPPDAEPYQGIVSIDQGRLEWSIEDYLQRSEQLETRLWLGCADGRARGMLIQRLPISETEVGEDFDVDAWNRLSHLAATIHPRELLELGPIRLLGRLFHEEQVRIHEAEPQRFFCSCTRERTASALQIMGSEEVESILRDEGEVSVECQFCREEYRWSEHEARALFA